MGYERPERQRLPEKHRSKRDGAIVRHKDRDKASSEVVVPYHAIFVKDNGAYTGVASIQVPPAETGRAKYIGWLKVLRDFDGWRNWILPVPKMTQKKVTVGNLQLAIQKEGVVVSDEREFSEILQRQLGHMVEFAYKDLLQNKPTPVKATTELIESLQTRFPQEHTAKIKAGEEVYCLESKLHLPVYDLI